MEPERYTDLEHFCGTDPVYRTWLARWSPPPGIELWVDNQVDLFHQARAEPPRELLHLRVATRVSFHLVDSVAAMGQPCVDIGCGQNYFRGFYAHIWGVDPRSPQHRDEELTPAWYQANWGQWPAVVSICSLHFWPQREVVQQMHKVRGLLRPGGRAMVSLNRARIQEHTPDWDEALLLRELAQLPGLERWVWIDQPQDAGMDGNIWIWMRA